MNSFEKLETLVKQGKHICVGLDTDIKKIPAVVRKSLNPLYEFNRLIVESTITEAAAYKLNFAFYESHGLEGFTVLRKTVELIRSKREDVLIIGDAKRGDIGNTSMMYAKAIFDELGFDCSTIAPYMGKDSLDPFFEYEGKINFILVLTSNKGSEDFEKLLLSDGTALYKSVLQKIKSWYPANQLGTVFGATRIENLKEDIDDLKGTTVLVPGVGAQGGSAGEVASIFHSAGHRNFLINSSRNIIYASQEEDFASSAYDELQKLNREVNQISHSV